MHKGDIIDSKGQKMNCGIGNTKKQSAWSIILIGLAPGWLASGCIVTSGCSSAPPVQASRTVELGGDMPQNPTLVVQSHNGDIRATGNAPQLRILATITGRGWSQEQAQGLIGQVGIDMKTSDQKVLVKANIPQCDLANTISIAYEIFVPNPCGLELTSHNGGIRIEAAQGTIHGESHNGSVEVFASNGPIVARSHNGKITVKQFVGDVDATTNNGGVELVQAENASPAARIRAVSHNGSIHLTTQSDLSAKTRLRTHNGSIHCEKPITVAGEIDKQNLNGVMGSGLGDLSLETHNGSIRLR